MTNSLEQQVLTQEKILTAVTKLRDEEDDWEIRTGMNHRIDRLNNLIRELKKQITERQDN